MLLVLFSFGYIMSYRLPRGILQEIKVFSKHKLEHKHSSEEKLEQASLSSSSAWALPYISFTAQWKSTDDMLYEWESSVKISMYVPIFKMAW